MMLDRIQFTLLKVEGTEGSDASPVGTDAVQFVEPVQPTLDAEIKNPREGLNNMALDVAAPLAPAGKYYEIPAKVHLRGAGVAYATTVVPECSEILQMAGFSETIDATGGAEKVTYETANTGLKTATAYFYERLDDAAKDIKHIALACRVPKMTMTWAAGKPVEVDFTLRGKYSIPTDATAAAVTPTYATVVPFLFGASGSFSIGSNTAAVLRSLTIAVEQTLAARLSGNAADSLAGYRVAGQRKLAFSALIESDKLATYDPYTLWAAATSGAISATAGTVGSGYNNLTLTADKATIDKITYQPENGLVLLKLDGTLSPEGTNRCKLVFAK